MLIDERHRGELLRRVVAIAAHRCPGPSNVDVELAQEFVPGELEAPLIPELVTLEKLRAADAMAGG